MVLRYTPVFINPKVTVINTVKNTYAPLSMQHICKSFIEAMYGIVLYIIGYSVSSDWSSCKKKNQRIMRKLMPQKPKFSVNALYAVGAYALYTDQEVIGLSIKEGRSF